VVAGISVSGPARRLREFARDDGREPRLFGVWRCAVLDHLLTIELRQGGHDQPLAQDRHRLIVLTD